MDGQKGSPLNGWMDGWMEGWMDGVMNCASWMKMRTFQGCFFICLFVCFICGLGFRNVKWFFWDRWDGLGLVPVVIEELLRLTEDEKKEK